MAIDYRQIIDDLKNAVLGVAKGAAKEFLDEHKDAKEFLETRAKRLAEMGEDYLKAKTDEERETIMELVSVVQQSIRSELAGIALDAEVAAREKFGVILETALGIFVKALPVILAAL